MNLVIKPFLILICLWLTCITANAESSSNDDEYVLERAIVFMRHGVRPPTKSAAEMAKLSDQPWPGDADWGAPPGELTPHGALAITRMGLGLRQHYARLGLFASSGASAAQALVWGDAADQRTRATALLMAAALSGNNNQPVAANWAPEKGDPLFDGLGTKVCKLDPEQASQAILVQSTIETPEVNMALKLMQPLLAPTACEGGAGACLQGPSRLVPSDEGVKLSGPLSTGASVSEALLLEYENGLPMSQVGFGRVDSTTISQLLMLHEHSSALTRRTPYIATRRAYPLTKFILHALNEENGQLVAPALDRQGLIVLVGHDTNLSNLAGVFGLDWHLDQQPDSTAPGTALVFERWHNGADGNTIVKLRLFYQTMDQVRNLTDAPIREVQLVPAVCGNSSKCELDGFTHAVTKILPTDCNY